MWLEWVKVMLSCQEGGLLMSSLSKVSCQHCSSVHAKKQIIERIAERNMGQKNVYWSHDLFQPYNEQLHVNINRFKLLLLLSEVLARYN